MIGIVSATTVLLHPVLIARGFGVGCLFRCWWAIATRQDATFLQLAWKAARA